MKRYGVVVIGVAVLMKLACLVPSAAQDSLNVTMVGRLEISYPFHVVVRDNLAYVAASDSGLLVINVANSTNPMLVGRCGSLNSATGICLSCNFAFVTNWWGGLWVVDVIDPANPVEVGYCSLPTICRNVAVSDSYAYVAGSWGLRIIDVENPSNPVEVGYYNTLSGSVGVAVSNGYAYVATSHGGLQIIDVTNPAAPTQISSIMSSAWSVALSDSYAYVGDMEPYGLRIVDIVDPINPIALGRCDLWDYPYDIAVSGSYAFVANRAHGLRVIYIANAYNPVMTGYYDTPGWADGVDVRDNLAYVADCYWLEVFDCSQALSAPSDNPARTPVTFSLLPAYPNPFNSATRISYSVAAAGRVQLVIYDLLGRQVGTLVDRTLAPGAYSATWDAGNLSSGIYFCKMEAGGFQQVQKLTLLK